jgi:hypothetical protein
LKRLSHGGVFGIDDRIVMDGVGHARGASGELSGESTC